MEEGERAECGMVAKIELAEIRAPFVRAGLVAGSVALLLSGFGVGLILLMRRTLLTQLGQSEAWGRAIVDHAPGGIVTIDERGTVESFNAAAEKMFGYSAHEVVGRNVSMLMPSPDREQHDGYLLRYLQGGDAKVIGVTREVPALTREGVLFPVHLHVSEVWLGSRRVFAAIIEDVSQLMETEEQNYIMNARLRDSLANQEKLGQKLESAMYAAEEANRAKSEFLANMSHEIRTPMTAILGFAEVLLEEENIVNASPIRIDAAKTIRRNGEHLLSIINDILDLSKIESGKMTVESIACSPEEIVREIHDLMCVRAEAKDLTLDMEFLGDIPEFIQSDSTRIRQILINMIGNAIKFTETGGVRLIIRLVPDEHDPRMQFDVIDTGVGMSEEQIAILFQPFAQADTSTTRNFGGTGLGLTICKRFARMLGGDIEIIDTKLGMGTRFRATIIAGSIEGVKMIDPSHRDARTAPNEVSSASPPSPPLEGCCVLLAEDGPDNQRLISFLLKKAGAEVTVKENGKLALEEALAAREQGRPYTVILMDMQMPVMGGYEATSKLREADYVEPIIALTAHAMAGDREKCLDAGCDDYATKPINKNTLITLITHWRAEAESGSPTLHPEARG